MTLQTKARSEARAELARVPKYSDALKAYKPKRGV